MALIQGVDFAYIYWSTVGEPIRCRALERPDFNDVRINPQRRQCTAPAVFVKWTPVGTRFYCAEHLIVPVLRWH